MPSAINADNGVVSGTAGLKSSADNSGVLDLQTNGTTAISISASQVVTFANQPAYTGGTANGVLYLNGSKVLTSGSALVFDGTNLGVGVTPTQKLDIATASGDCIIRLGNGTSQARLAIDSDGPYIYALTSGDNALRVFTPAGSQAMTLDASGNLAVGATSAASRLYVESTSPPQAVFRNPTGASYTSLRLYNDANSAARALEIDYFGSSAGGGERAEIFVTGAYPLLFGTSNAERARITSGGAFGVGVTPSAWDFSGPGQTPLQTMSWALSNDVNSHYQTNNAYYGSSAWRYIASKFATRYDQDSASGQHKWFVAPSGTAGNGITWTQAMTLTADKYLLTPFRPAFSARTLSNAATNSYVTTLPAVLLFTTVSTNIGSSYNSANGRFTAPVAGMYYFSWSILVDNDATANAITSASLFVNGTSLGYSAYNQNSGSVYIQMSQSVVVSLNANDYVTCNGNNGFIHTGSETAFTGYLLG